MSAKAKGGPAKPRFLDAVDQALPGHGKPGLQAIKGEHRGLIQAKDPKALAGSVDLDKALAQQDASASRWDYGIAYRVGDAERIAWVEVHGAKPSEVDAILRKAAALDAWLNGHGKAVRAVDPPFGGRKFWIATQATVSVTAASVGAKRLAAQGIRLAGRVLRLPSDLESR